MFLTYTRSHSLPLVEFGNKTAGYPEYLGQSLGRPVRGRPGQFRMPARRPNLQMPSWGMLGGTVPTLPSALLISTAVKAKVAGENLNRLKRKYRQTDVIATIGPGLTARSPFVSMGHKPRFIGRNFFGRQRRSSEMDVLSALSGASARSQGQFLGSKTAFLAVTATRSATGFTTTASRAGDFTTQPGG